MVGVWLLLSGVLVVGVLGVVGVGVFGLILRG